MKNPRIAGFLLFATLATQALAATTTTVVDVPVEGATQRYLYVRPDAPIATILSIPGGDGIYGIQNDGSMNTLTALCGPVSRNRQALAAQGVSVALVDATSTGAIYNYNDILEVVKNLRARDNVPIWVFGGSASTSAATNAGANLPGSVGMMIFSPQRPSNTVSSVRRPSLVVYHSGDDGQFGSLYFNALTSATVKERIVYSGGVNAGCGFHLFEGLDAQYVADISSFITRNNAATASAEVNVQGLWWRAPANSESGWGVNLTHQGEILFGTWFTYDSDGRGMWLVMPSGAKGSGNSWSGALYRTTGPAFNAMPFNPSGVGVTEVGTANFTFTDASNGTFAYMVNGISQSKPITRQIYSSPVPECTVGGAAGSTPNYQALWWGAPANSESGWGLNITHQGDILFATWFTYDLTGRGMWVVMSNGAKTGPGTYAGALHRTTGPAFNANPWLGTGVVATAVGSGSFAFTDANNGTFSYTVDGISQVKAITRQVYSSPVTTCR